MDVAPIMHFVPGTLVLLLVCLTSFTSTHPLGSPKGAQPWSLKRERTRAVGSGYVLTGPSHLLMWLQTEKELLPWIGDLANSARGLLSSTAESQQLSLAEAEDLVVSLPTLGALSDVPSAATLLREQQQEPAAFLKTLIENGYESVSELRNLLKELVLSSDVTDNDDSEGPMSDSSDVTDNDDDNDVSALESFMGDLGRFVDKYEKVLLTFYQSDRKSLTTTSRTTDPSKPIPSRRHRLLQLLDLAVTRLDRVSFVLEYSIEFSWLERLGQFTSRANNKTNGKKGKGKPSNGERKNAKKN